MAQVLPSVEYCQVPLPVTAVIANEAQLTLTNYTAVAAQVEAAKPKRPTALILAPTRELAEQIMREVEPLAAARGHKCAAVYGGTGYGAQQNALRRGVEILVACPGRLEDLIDRNEVGLEDVRIAVLDEAEDAATPRLLLRLRQGHPALDAADQAEIVLAARRLVGGIELQRQPDVCLVGEAEALRREEIEAVLLHPLVDDRVVLRVARVALAAACGSGVSAPSKGGRRAARCFIPGSA